jgi:hypothetical protein
VCLVSVSTFRTPGAVILTSVTVELLAGIGAIGIDPAGVAEVHTVDGAAQGAEAICLAEDVIRAFFIRRTIEVAVERALFPVVTIFSRISLRRIC